jgi:ubiquinone/menaquinone biosynthesis C-methylase UbiE
MSTIDFSTVTELAGDEVSRQQIDRICHRYCWAAAISRDKDVLEAACGSGQGLGMLALAARSLKAGDYTDNLLQMALKHYGDRIELRQFDAQAIPYSDRSFDVILLFEALYYIPSAEKFVKECRRLLRPGGKVLIATANKDLFDFNPSPFSYKYYGVVELEELFSACGFSVQCFGYGQVSQASAIERALRPVKAFAVKNHLIPKTMGGKKLLKRLLFGKLIPMPAELTPEMTAYAPPQLLAAGRADTGHKVIYCAASLP